MAPLPSQVSERTIPWDKEIPFPAGGLIVGSFAIIYYKERPVPNISRNVHIKVDTNKNFVTCVDFDELMRLVFHGRIINCGGGHYLIHLYLKRPCRNPEIMIERFKDSLRSGCHSLQVKCNRITKNH
jgi:hypothetical protein